MDLERGGGEWPDPFRDGAGEQRDQDDGNEPADEAATTALTAEPTDDLELVLTRGRQQFAELGEPLLVTPGQRVPSGVGGTLALTAPWPRPCRPR